MQNKESAPEKKSLKSETMFVILVLVISALLCFAANIPNRAENRQIRDREAALYQKVKDLEAEQAKLAATKEALKNDPMFVEYYLRKKCGLKRPGEKVYSE